MSRTSPPNSPRLSDRDLLAPPVQLHHNAQTYDVFLHRYMLSYSASCPCLIRPLVQLFEKTLLPTWVSHYAISIQDEQTELPEPENYHLEDNYPSDHDFDDDYDDERPFLEHPGRLQFQLYREGSLPFASIAYFQIRSPRHDTRIRRDEKIGTTTIKPEDIVQHIKRQDDIYRTKNVCASNCLLGVPREYSLLQANCQHFILELIRRIGVDDEGGAYEKLERASQRPRIWCRYLLSVLGFLLNCAFALLPLEPVTCILLYMYHVAFSLVMIQDSTMRKLRVELSQNEQRFLPNAFAEHRRRTGKRKLLSNSTVLTMLSLGMTLPLGFEVIRLFRCWGLWAFGLLFIIAFFYYVFIYAFASRLLAQLKSRNRITSIRIYEKSARVTEAYKTLQDRWPRYDGSPPCPERLSWQSGSSRELCRKCFLDQVRREQERWQTDFGRLDFEDAVMMWESNHPRPIEIVKSYEKRWMLVFYIIFGILLVVWLGFHVAWPDPMALYVCIQSTRV